MIRSILYFLLFVPFLLSAQTDTCQLVDLNEDGTLSGITQHRKAGSNDVLLFNTGRGLELRSNLVSYMPSGEKAWSFQAEEMTIATDFIQFRDGGFLLACNRFGKPVPGKSPVLQSKLTWVTKDGKKDKSVFIDLAGQDILTAIMLHPDAPNVKFPIYAIGQRSMKLGRERFEEPLLYNMNAAGEVNWVKSYGISALNMRPGITNLSSLTALPSGDLLLNGSAVDKYAFGWVATVSATDGEPKLAKSTQNGLEGVFTQSMTDGTILTMRSNTDGTAAMMLLSPELELLHEMHPSLTSVSAVVTGDNTGTIYGVKRYWRYISQPLRAVVISYTYADGKLTYGKPIEYNHNNKAVKKIMPLKGKGDRFAVVNDQGEAGFVPQSGSIKLCGKEGSGSYMMGGRSSLGEAKLRSSDFSGKVGYGATPEAAVAAREKIDPTSRYGGMPPPPPAPPSSADRSKLPLLVPAGQANISSPPRISVIAYEGGYALKIQKSMIDGKAQVRVTELGRNGKVVIEELMDKRTYNLTIPLTDYLNSYGFKVSVAWNDGRRNEIIRVQL